MFYVLGWVLFGLVVGLIAKLITPGDEAIGFAITILLGISGALLGGWLGNLVRLYPLGHPAGFFLALIGALGLLFLYRWRLVRRPSRVSGNFDRAVI
jgi:uncharacterized membrane protein YeaQ/YmgE (transglycosylase-associated protein family)